MARISPGLICPGVTAPVAGLCPARAKPRRSQSLETAECLAARSARDRACALSQAPGAKRGPGSARHSPGGVKLTIHSRTCLDLMPYGASAWALEPVSHCRKDGPGDTALVLVVPYVLGASDPRPAPWPRVHIDSSGIAR